jgi:hypothetical protein
LETLVIIRELRKFMAKPQYLSTVIIAAYLLSGCVTAVSSRANPRFREQSHRIHSVALLPTEVKVYQIDAGGVREEIAEWSTQARKNVITALENVIRTKTEFSLKTTDEESLAERKLLLEETRSLYAAVSMMVLLHTYPNPNVPGHIFEEKLKNFDYSLGSEVGDLVSDSEALLFLDAEDHVWTAGRQALQALGVILGIGAGVATGVVIIPQMGGGTVVKAALVDSHTGDILWANIVGSGAGADLRDSVGASNMISELFKDFPVAHGQSEENAPQ